MYEKTGQEGCQEEVDNNIQGPTGISGNKSLLFNTYGKNL